MVHLMLLRIWNQLQQMALGGSALQEVAAMRSLRQMAERIGSKQLVKILRPPLTQ